MATTSDFSVGLAHKFFQAMAGAGWIPDEVNDLAQDLPSLRDIRNVRLGTAIIMVTKRLRQCVVVDLPARPDAFILGDYFKTIDNLCPWDSNKTNILLGGGAVEATPATKIAGFDLLHDSDGEQIHLELSEGCVFQGARVFFSHLAGMIDRQIGGAEGPLLNNGRVNVFYVRLGGEVIAVYVSWCCDEQEWLISACGLDHHALRAGNRVFSATVVA